MRNPNTDSKTVKSINTKSAAARAAAAATGTAANSAATTANIAAKAMTAREINAAFKQNLAVLEENPNLVTHAEKMCRSYVGRYLKEMGYAMLTATVKEETGKLSYKLYIYYIGEDVSGYNEEELEEMCTDNNCVGGIPYVEITNGKPFIKVFDTAGGWSFAKSEVEKIVSRNYCKMNNIFNFDKYKEDKKEGGKKLRIIDRTKKKK